MRGFADLLISYSRKNEPRIRYNSNEVKLDVSYAAVRLSCQNSTSYLNNIGTRSWN